MGPGSFDSQREVGRWNSSSINRRPSSGAVGRGAVSCMHSDLLRLKRGLDNIEIDG